MARLAGLFVALCLALACEGSGATPGPGPRPAPAPTTRPTPAPAAARQATVRVDRRVELLSILCRLAGFEEYRRARATPYLEAVDRWFAPHAGHPAVALLRALRSQRGIGFDAPMLFAVHLDDQLGVVRGDELAAIDRRWAGVDAAALATAVRGFAATARLDAFLAEHATYHATLVRALEGVLAKEAPIAWFDAAFGPARAQFVAIPSAIAGPNNFGPRATAADGTQQLFQILGVSSRTGALEVDDQLVSLLVHEMAHAYVNPALAPHRDALERAAAPVYARVADAMRAQAYADAYTMVVESVVRSVVVSYLRDRRGEPAAAAALRAEERRSFLWLPALATALRELPAPGLRDLGRHGPRLAAWFTELGARYAKAAPPPPFVGPVDAIHQRDPAWAVPATGVAGDYARSIHARLRKTSAVIAAAATTLRDQPGRDLVAYGTPGDNPVIAAVAKRAGWRFERDKLTLGTRTFTGPGLVLIAAFPRPDDPRRGVAIYAAADPATVVGINGLRHGPRDWLVARKDAGAFQVVATGDFVRAPDGSWQPEPAASEAR